MHSSIICHFCQCPVILYHITINNCVVLQKHDLRFLPVAQFHLHQPKLETWHAEIWQAVYFSLNRGRCGSVMLACVLCQWKGAPCGGATAPRQWQVPLSCHTPRRLQIWFELSVFMLFNRIFIAMCHSLQSVTTTDWVHMYAGSRQGVHRGCLNRQNLSLIKA